MELKVRKIGNEYGVLLPKPLMDDLALGEGSLLKAENHHGVLHMTPIDADFSLQVEAFLRTEVQHGRSFRELAK